MYKIISFEQKYRDDAIFCLLSAKDSLGRLPSLNEDLLDIQKNYFDKGDMFWVAIDDNNRVIGMIGTNTTSKTDMWLKRLFIKPTLKRQGLGSALLKTAEEYARAKGIVTIHTRFSDDFGEASKFYPAKGFIESERSNGLRHLIKIIENHPV
ncbi:MAG: GNAT family N-acetyltransferase [Clostridia bacterium]|nr:GNAT family N-acetyltransferase [Clostridia bacterium]